LMKVLKPMLHADVLTVTCKTITQNLKNTRVLNNEVIRPLNKPAHAAGGIAILTGNLAPAGAVVKTVAVSNGMLRHAGPARVFDSEREAVEAMRKKAINAGTLWLFGTRGPLAVLECLRCSYLLPQFLEWA